MKEQRLKIALVGNPNSGKSTLFNILTGLNQKIANFPGVTVEKKSGNCTFFSESRKSISAEIIDLPGTYSLYPKTLDEKIPFVVLCDEHDESHPDIVVVVADGTNLKRSLFLCTQVIDLKIPCILAINMIDLVTASGLVIDYLALQKELDIKIVGINASNGEGVDELKRLLTMPVYVSNKTFLACRKFAPELINSIQQKFHFRSDYIAFLAAHNYKEISLFKQNAYVKDALQKILTANYFEPFKTQSTETLERYQHISNLLSLFIKNPELEQTRSISARLDKVLTHGVWGYVSFLFILFVIFQVIFSLAQVPMNMVDNTFVQLTAWLSKVLPGGVLSDLFINGIIAGLAGIVIFIPQIALLFAFIAILEDSGYMARISFIMDKLMRKFGLNGRSVIPLISGVACAVPAILSTRTIQNWKERYITILITPLMSCSARLPVYTLLIALVIPSKTVMYGLINLQGLVLMLLYLIGFFAAILSAFVFKYLIKSKERSFYIMEIPVYRMPRWKNVLITIFDKVKIFLFDAGKIIIAISIVLWVLSSFGPIGRQQKIAEKYELLKQQPGANIEHLENAFESERLENSYAGIAGHWLEPAIAPLGFDWKIGIALITSFAAREVFVGTMSTIYSVGNSDDLLTVRERMAGDTDKVSGKPRYNLATGISLMLFYAFAMQCMSTLAVVKRETGNWGIPLFQFIYMSLLAYAASFVAYTFLK